MMNRISLLSLTLFPIIQGFAPLPSVSSPSGPRLPDAFDQQQDVMEQLSRRTIDTKLHSIDISSLESSISIANAASDIFSNAGITKAFSAATFGPQYLWILLVLFPNTKVRNDVLSVVHTRSRIDAKY